MKNIAKFLLYLVAIFFSLVLIYGLVALLLTLFPKKIETHKPQDQTVYLYHNAMHSDIILDLKTVTQPWRQQLSEIIRENRQGYITFGWGDQETYLSTPQWADIPTSTALKALFTNTPSVIHVSYYPYIPLNSHEIKKIKLTAQQSLNLEDSLIRAFGEKPIFLRYGYGSDDAFYQSEEIYNLFHTCNTWTGDRLRESNISMSYWTPLSYNVVNALP